MGIFTFIYLFSGWTNKPKELVWPCNVFFEGKSVNGKFAIGGHALEQPPGIFHQSGSILQGWHHVVFYNWVFPYDLLNHMRLFGFIANKL